MSEVFEFNVKFINLMLAGDDVSAKAEFKKFTGMSLELGRGNLVCKSIERCQSCGCDTEVLFFEKSVVGGYCNDCDQKIWQELHAHEMRLSNSGYYG